MAPPEQPSRIYLLTYPRTASNLFVSMLSLKEQKDVLPSENGGYFYISLIESRMLAHLDSPKHIAEWSEEERTNLSHGLQECTKKFEEYLEAAEAQGKIAFVKEHAPLLANPVAATKWRHGEDSTHETLWTLDTTPNRTRSAGNDTIFSDEFLASWKPVFLIRHPAMVFPSFLRAMNDIEWDSDYSLYAGLHWSRSMYEWFANKFGKTGPPADNETMFPLVIDADDIITNPEVVVKFSKLVGLDPSKVRFGWEAKYPEHMSAVSTLTQRMLSTISSSTGILKNKAAANMDVDEEAKKWKEEFGEAAGKRLEEFVRAALPDYEYMKERRLRP